MKQSEVTQMMRNLVKNQWCAAHNGTITMKDVKAMNKQQLLEEYEYICRCLEKDRLLSAQYNLFRPKPAISEPPSKRQRVEHISSPTVFVPAATTPTADDPDSTGGGGSNPAGSAFGTPITDSTVPTPAAMASASSHHEIGISPFADSADSSSPSNVSTDHIPIDGLFVSTSGGLNDFFMDSDEDAQIGMSRVAADPDSDDEVLAEILFWGKYISGAGLSGLWTNSLMLRLLSTVKDKHFQIMPLLLPSRRKYFTYLKQLLPHVYREDILLLRRRMNSCYPKEFFQVLDLTNGKTVYMLVDKVYPIRATLLERMLRHRLTVPPSYCRDVVVAGNIIQTVQDGLRQAYECLASASIACTARQMVFSSPWLTAKKESGSPLQTALVCNSNPLMVARLPKTGCPEQTAIGKDLSNPLYGCDGLPKIVRVFQFTLDSRSEKLDWFLLHQDWKMLFFDVATSFDFVVHRVHVVSFDADVLDVASTVSAACIVAACIVAAALVSAGSSSKVSAGYIIEFLLEDLEAVPADYELYSRVIS
ncbi:hypothetical protein Tco_0756758 [Tanacetum coccineum]